MCNMDRTPPSALPGLRGVGPSRLLVGYGGAVGFAFGDDGIEPP